MHGSLSECISWQMVRQGRPLTEQALQYIRTPGGLGHMGNNAWALGQSTSGPEGVRSPGTKWPILGRFLAYDQGGINLGGGGLYCCLHAQTLQGTFCGLHPMEHV